MDVQRHISFIKQTLQNDTPYWAQMKGMCENSPWHREENVAVHTEMVMDAYVDRNQMNSKEDMMAMIALLFHDTGKPWARALPENKCYSKERGTYYRSKGHEKKSARIFEDFFCTYYKTLFAPAGLDREDVTPITAMIEYHLPFDYRSGSGSIRQGLFETMSSYGLVNTYCEVLISDALGRDSDDKDEKIKNTKAWIEEFKKTQVVPEPLNKENGEMIILCGPSGCGKSSFVKKHFKDGDYHYSWDIIREEVTEAEGLLSNDQTSIDRRNMAYEYTFKEGKAKFESAYQRELSRIVRVASGSGANVFIDNTNLSRKRRKLMTTAAKRAGLNVRFVVFPISEKSLLGRIEGRTDHKIPHAAVQQQYDSLSIPLPEGNATLTTITSNI